MSFAPVCPKCGSRSVSVIMEKMGWRGEKKELRLSCMCGVRLYGAAAEAEVESQRVAWVEPAPKRQNTPARHDGDLRHAAIREQIRKALAEARRLKAESTFYTNSVDNLWKAFSLQETHSRAAFARNRLRVDVATIHLLVGEVEQEAEKAPTIQSFPGIRRASKHVQEKLAKAQALRAGLPRRAAEAEVDARKAAVTLAKELIQSLVGEARA